MSKRYLREVAELRANLPPYILALPDEENVLDLHFIFAYMPVLDGHPKAEPYAHGVYWFTMTFPHDYPHAAPKVVSCTENGRFVAGMSICVSETVFKQRAMNTALSVAAVLVSFSLFMQDDTQPGHVGWVRTGNDVVAVRTRLAHASCAQNLVSPVFRRMFPGITNDAAQNHAWIASMKDAPAPAAPSAPAPAPAPVGVSAPPPPPSVGETPTTRLAERIVAEAMHQAKLARRRERDRARRAAAAAAGADVEEVPAAPPAKRARTNVAGSAAEHAAAPAPAADDAVYAPARWLVAAPVIATGGDMVAARIVEAATRAEDAAHALAALAPDAVALLDTGRGAGVLRLLREQATGLSHVREGLCNVIPAVEEIMLRRNLPFDRAAPALAPAPVPLYPHQLDALPTMVKLDAESGGGILADPPGFGKTYMIAALILATLATVPHRTVIVVQARLRGAWRRTMQLFGVPDDRYDILSTNAPMFSDYMRDHRVSRVVIDEAHLVIGLCARARNNYHGLRRWLVTATPTAGVLAAFATGDRVYRHLIRRLPEENTAALPAARETDLAVDLTAAERRLLGEAAHAAERAAHVLHEFNFRNWPRVEDAVAYAAEAMLHGDVQGATARLAALPGGGAGGADLVPSRRLAHNAPGAAAQVDRWLATSGAAAPGAKCQVCDEPFGPARAGVLFRACSHLVCTECFDRNYARAGKPFCGLPCAPTDMSKCYLLSVLTRQPAAPEPAPEPAARGAGSKTGAILAFVAGARARGKRVAIVLHSDAAVDAVAAALARERPAVVRTRQGGAHTGAVAAAVGGGAPPPVLVAQERAVAVGLNLQQYHYVLLPTPLPDAARLVQLGGRFVRPGAGVPEVRFVHMHARGTFEERLSRAVRAGGAQKMPPEDFVRLLRG